ncbi:MAG: DHH family phosphoesterase, partial [Lachnospiraceae bacterium]|nr:DHH family phosphoesterase [Lachnospiraceae bacterium]
MDLKECAAFLREKDEYIIVTHRRPDGDTLGSAAGLCHALRRMGKTAWLFPNSEITDTYLPYVREYLAGKNYRYAAAVAVDVAEESLFCRGWTGGIDLWLDHHPPRGPVRENAVIWSHKASCGELVLELIDELCGDITKEEADLLYMAVSTDTG